MTIELHNLPPGIPIIGRRRVKCACGSSYFIHQTVIEIEAKMDGDELDTHLVQVGSAFECQGCGKALKPKEIAVKLEAGDYDAAAPGAAENVDKKGRIRPSPQSSEQKPKEGQPQQREKA